jgi:hypothetical protein
MAKRTCSIEDCPEPHYGRGWCRKHYARWWSKGTTDDLRPTVEQRFWSCVDKQGPVPERRPDLGPCWLWTSGTSAGYGKFYVGQQSFLAHRWAYERFVGPIPEGLEPDHLCRVHTCINYERHLELVTHLENVLRGNSPSAHHARKTHCKHGHEFTQANTYHHPSGGRRCRECSRMWQRDYTRRRRL